MKNSHLREFFFFVEPVSEPACPCWLNRILLHFFLSRTPPSRKSGSEREYTIRSRSSLLLNATDELRI